MKIKIFFLFLATLLFLPILAHADTDHLVISQVQTTGGPGKTTNDFLEIYNPTTRDVDIKDWKLTKKTKTGTESSLGSFNSRDKTTMKITTRVFI